MATIVAAKGHSCDTLYCGEEFRGLTASPIGLDWPGRTYTEVVTGPTARCAGCMPLGVRIHVGTEPPNPFIVPGASVYEEMRLLGGTGFSTEETWIAVTRNGGMRSGGGLMHQVLHIPADTMYSAPGLRESGFREGRKVKMKRGQGKLNGKMEGDRRGEDC